MVVVMLPKLCKDIWFHFRSPYKQEKINNVVDHKNDEDKIEEDIHKQEGERGRDKLFH